MSATPEILSRLAGGSTWKTERLDRIAGALTADDIAGALAGLGAGPAELVGVKYAGYPIGRLHGLVYREAASIARRQRWWGQGNETAGILRRMARLAVAEVVAPVMCGACSGRGMVIEGESCRPCAACGGGGLGAISWPERARVLGLDPAHMEQARGRARRRGRIEQDQYHALYALVQGWESEGIAHLSRRLFGE